MIDLCVYKQAEYIVKEANQEEATTKSNENTEKESKENNVWGGKKI